ncbi:hypothetical protein OCGS_2305 [Oceaniovalibus guishaninsula JLT2003]|uniref:Uncharacterized protein n=1 Tax=Oceaniovalibus guishaninsula JLT2003 TaxID=1231392 RepID=K2H7I0_9RHOB|nr:hypothetical protein [Oceaniovalibus guishaninsula]EKE43573.1 hypothetical protein OCGS_2305 [Oceaniovalibus guishaninsula JLT2003]
MDDAHPNVTATLHYPPGRTPPVWAVERPVVWALRRLKLALRDHRIDATASRVRLATDAAEIVLASGADRGVADGIVLTVRPRGATDAAMAADLARALLRRIEGCHPVRAVFWHPTLDGTVKALSPLRREALRAIARDKDVGLLALRLHA